MTSRKILSVIALTLVVACLPAAVSRVHVGLAIMRPTGFDVLAREASPDHLLEAIHVMPRTGATDGFVHWIYVAPAGGAAGNTGPKDRVFVADRADSGINMAWATNSQLIVSGKAARVFTSKGATIRLPNGEARQIGVELEIEDLRRP
jgi:hypothetical protein